MGEPVTDARERSGPADLPFAALADDLPWPDVEAGALARRSVAPGAGRLAELGRWLTETLGPQRAASRATIRLLIAADIDDDVATLAETHGVTARAVTSTAGDATADRIAAAFRDGVRAADDAVDEGVDLLIIGGKDASVAPHVLVSVLTGAEPIALLPRGAASINTSDWIARATVMRDDRRRLTPLRGQPEELLQALGSVELAALVGSLLRATSRRTPVVLDGTAAVAAALFCHEQQPRAARWWLIADRSPDPAHARAISAIDLRPVLEVGMSRDDGLAGLLTVPLLRSASIVAVTGKAESVTTGNATADE